MKTIKKLISMLLLSGIIFISFPTQAQMGTGDNTTTTSERHDMDDDDSGNWGLLGLAGLLGLLGLRKKDVNKDRRDPNVNINR